MLVKQTKLIPPYATSICNNASNGVVILPAVVFPCGSSQTKHNDLTCVTNIYDSLINHIVYLKHQKKRKNILKQSLTDSIHIYRVSCMSRQSNPPLHLQLWFCYFLYFLIFPSLVRRNTRKLQKKILTYAIGKILYWPRRLDIGLVLYSICVFTDLDSLGPKTRRATISSHLWPTRLKK